MRLFKLTTAGYLKDITTEADFAAIPTAGLEVGNTFRCWRSLDVDNNMHGALFYYALASIDTDGEPTPSTPDCVVPNDHNSVTNPRFWRLLMVLTAGGDSGFGGLIIPGTIEGAFSIRRGGTFNPNGACLGGYYYTAQISGVYSLGPVERVFEYGGTASKNVDLPMAIGDNKTVNPGFEVKIVHSGASGTLTVRTAFAFGGPVSQATVTTLAAGQACVLFVRSDGTWRKLSYA